MAGWLADIIGDIPRTKLVKSDQVGQFSCHSKDYLESTWTHYLNSTGVAMARDLWENVGMANAKIKVSQVVVSDGMVGVYRIVRVSPDGQTADIEKFDISTQKSLGDPIRSVAMNKLTAYEENASEADARIARESVTED
jgi:hypothetical protein